MFLQTGDLSADSPAMRLLAVRHQEQIATQAREALRIVQDRYASGITTITELLRAETALVRARSDVLAARYDQYVGYANVLFATGQLKDVGPFGS